MILSPAFDVGEMTIGHTPDRLKEISEQIRSGHAFMFDAAEVSAVAKEHRLANETTPARLACDFAKWITPPVLLLAGIWLAIWIS